MNQTQTTKSINTNRTSTKSWGKYRFPQNPDTWVETRRDSGSITPTLDTLSNELIKAPQDFLDQLLGTNKQKLNASGEIRIGESIVIDHLLQTDEQKRLKAQITHERKLRQDEQSLTNTKEKELKLQIHALREEVIQIAKTTSQLTKEAQLAAMQEPVDPGIYHLNFFQEILSSLKKIRRRIEDAHLWVRTMNERSAKRKRLFWGQVGISGAKRLLSSEDSMVRSAG